MMFYPAVPRILENTAFKTASQLLISRLGMRLELTNHLELDCLGGFIDDIAVKDGVIYYTDTSDPRDVIHEMLHLAVIPPKYRGDATGDIGTDLWDKIGFLPGVLRGKGPCERSPEQELLIFDISLALMHTLKLHPLDFHNEAYLDDHLDKLYAPESERPYLAKFNQQTSILHGLQFQ